MSKTTSPRFSRRTKRFRWLLIQGLKLCLFVFFTAFVASFAFVTILLIAFFTTPQEGKALYLIRASTSQFSFAVDDTDSSAIFVQNASAFVGNRMVATRSNPANGCVQGYIQPAPGTLMEFYVDQGFQAMRISQQVNSDAHSGAADQTSETAKPASEGPQDLSVATDLAPTRVHPPLVATLSPTNGAYEIVDVPGWPGGSSVPDSNQDAQNTTNLLMGDAGDFSNPDLMLEETVVVLANPECREAGEPQAAFSSKAEPLVFKGAGEIGQRLETGLDDVGPPALRRPYAFVSADVHMFVRETTCWAFWNRDCTNIFRVGEGPTLTPSGASIRGTQTRSRNAATRPESSYAPTVLQGAAYFEDGIYHIEAATIADRLTIIQPGIGGDRARVANLELSLFHRIMAEPLVAIILAAMLASGGYILSILQIELDKLPQDEGDESVSQQDDKEVA